MTEADIPNLQTFNNLKTIVDKVVARSKYNKVDLNALFSFMDQWEIETERQRVKEDDLNWGV